MICVTKEQRPSRSAVPDLGYLPLMAFMIMPMTARTIETVTGGSVISFQRAFNNSMGSPPYFI